MDILLTPYDGAILGPIAKVLGWIMNGIYYISFGNVGVAIILLTIVIYIILFPLTYKQQKFSKLTQKMQPELKAVQDKYKGKKDQASMQAMNAETQLVYQKYGVSPMGSCLQLLIQMPILFALYRVFYNIPAYITSVKEQFSGLIGMITNGSVADGSLALNFGRNLDVAKIVDQFSIQGLNKVNWATEKGQTLFDHLVDVFYKVPSTGWNPEHSDFIGNTLHVGNASILTDTSDKIGHFNNFLGLNISDSPFQIIRDVFVNGGAWWLVVVAALIPILSFLTQRINIKMTPTTNAGDQSSNTMKTMNMLMPLMSLVFAITLPVGLGIYWIAGAVVRSIQQFFLNKHFDKTDLDEIIEKNKDKVAKKKEKQGVYQDQIRKAAAIKTRSIESKANVSVDNDKEETLASAQEVKNNARPGSLAAKANMVKEFNERNSRK